MAEDAWRLHVSLGRRLDVEGCATFFIDVGEGKPLLLIHGWGSSSFSWFRNYRELSRDFRVIAVDLPGFGLSEPLRGGLSLGAVVEHLHRFLTVLGLEPVSLVGHSMGGVVAAAMASWHPESVEKMMLISPAFPVGGRGERRGFSGLVRRKMLARLLAPFLLRESFVKRALLSSVWRRQAIDDEVVAGFYMSIKNSGRALLEASNIIEGFNPVLLEKVKAPVLFLHGERDRWVPLQSSVEAAQRMGAEVIIIPDAGHIPQLERPETVNEAIMKFFMG